MLKIHPYSKFYRGTGVSFPNGTMGPLEDFQAMLNPETEEGCQFDGPEDKEDWLAEQRELAQELQLTNMTPVQIAVLKAISDGAFTINVHADGEIRVALT